MPASPSLEQQRILVTRPAHQAQSLCQRIQVLGGIPLQYPAIDIQAIVPNDDLQRCLDRIRHYDLAIFISANAVRYGLPPLLALGDLASHLKLAAVGQSTAKAMRSLHSAPHWVPKQSFNSEGLLALPQLQNMRHQHVVIFRGEGGREYLAEQLRARGAQVDYVNLYRRCLPQPHQADHPWLKNGAVDSIVMTSGEGLQNFLILTGNPAWLRDKNWVVISPRLAKAVTQAHMRGHIAVAPSSDDEGLLLALLNWV